YLTATSYPLGGPSLPRPAAPAGGQPAFALLVTPVAIPGIIISSTVRKSRRLLHYYCIYPPASPQRTRGHMRSRAMSALLHLLTGSQSRLSPVPSKTPPPPRARIRTYSSADREACIDIYRKNEPGHFPGGVGGQFEQFLDQPGYLKFVCSVGEEP